jgi:glutathione peroxidase
LSDTSSLFDLSFTTSRGETVPLATHRGHPVLVVNTASRCGFTPQDEGLQALHEAYRDQGLVLIGFPCDQFAHQVPGDDAAIEEFCRVNYGVDFPLSTKVDVNGKATHPVFEFLKARAGGRLGSASPPPSSWTTSCASSSTGSTARSRAGTGRRSRLSGSRTRSTS